jgi:hypothetical protein
VDAAIEAGLSPKELTKLAEKVAVEMERKKKRKPLSPMVRGLRMAMGIQVR